ncbi:MAG: hybrid sensor histidine kinase/response regulator [Arcobacteraceae bacterium]|nr:hybrid sensor histidine kinase/response regulator [Arcobacteraceae bacterium]
MTDNKETILIVDDNKSNIDVLLGILSAYDVIPALSGQTAIDVVTSENIDLILLDIMMPIMDGFEVCRILKNNSKTNKIPIIFLTAKYEMEDIKTGFNLGAVDYVTKPFNPIELLVRINTHLELRSYQKDLELKVKDEIEKNKLQEQILFQQSKQAEIGELLMHIAHQWKQPLSELGSINTYNMGKLELNHTIENDELYDCLNQSSTILKFMSNTVETFQKFYKPNCESDLFDIYEAIYCATNMITATLNYHNINLTIKQKECQKIYGKRNEYSQVILSILNNAKDIFLARDVKEPTIHIEISSSDNTAVVTILDNGGGVRLKNREDIFLPFVSQSNSSGIGLYMARIIIEKNNGSIEIENFKDGARFKIIMPNNTRENRE